MVKLKVTIAMNELKVAIAMSELKVATVTLNAMSGDVAIISADR